jgi:hypothetical protein
MDFVIPKTFAKFPPLSLLRPILGVSLDPYLTSQISQLLSLLFLLHVSSDRNTLSINLIAFTPLLLFAGSNHRLLCSKRLTRSDSYAFAFYVILLHVVLLVASLLFFRINALVVSYFIYRVEHSLVDALSSFYINSPELISSQSISPSLISLGNLLCVLAWLLLYSSPVKALIACSIILFFIYYFFFGKLFNLVLSNLVKRTINTISIDTLRRAVSLFAPYGLSAIIGSLFIYSTRYVYLLLPPDFPVLIGPALNQLCFSILSMPVLLVSVFSMQLSRRLSSVSLDKAFNLIVKCSFLGLSCSIFLSIFFVPLIVGQQLPLPYLLFFISSIVFSVFFWLIGSLFCFLTHSSSGGNHLNLNIPLLFAWFAGICASLIASQFLRLYSHYIIQAFVFSSCILFPSFVFMLSSFPFRKSILRT